MLLGDAASLYRRDFTVTGLRFLDDAFARDLESGSTRHLLVQIRSRHPAAPAVVAPATEGRGRVVFEEPQSAVAPGQVAVFYDGHRVLGGGFIAGEDC